MGGNRPFYAAPVIILALIALLAGPFGQVIAQSPEEFQDVSTQVEFGQNVTFKAGVDPQIAIQEAYLSLQPQGSEPIILPVEVNPNNEIIYTLDMAKYPLRPFSRVQYTFRLKDANGKEITSPEYALDYNDTRFSWQTINNDAFEVHWYDRDITFGQLILNTAGSGLESIQNILPSQLDQTVKIYVYNTANDMKGALPGTQSWIAGQSIPDLGVILLSIPIGPEDQLELQRQLPHEMMHVVLYRLLGEKTTNLPAWLVEGLASISEMNPNPEYATALMHSASEDQLLPLKNLCGGLPRDASGAFLAYAESASFVRYLHRTYGASAMRWLVEQYQNGLGCSEGIQTALGSSLTELEYRWKQQELRLNPESLIFRNLLPYLLLFLVLFGATAVTIIMTTQRRNRTEHIGEE